MREFLRWQLALLLLIPMGFGYVAGLVVSPLIMGFRAGCDSVENFAENYTARSRAERAKG